MERTDYRRFLIPPVSLPVLLLILFFLLIVFTLFSGAVLVAFAKLGIPPGVAYTLFVLALVGSFINIPIAEERTYEPVLTVREVRFMGIHIRCHRLAGLRGELS